MPRIALVSPYAWGTPGGVGGHVRALADELRRRDHDVLVLAPGGGDVPLGRTVGIRTNGAVSELALGPSAVLRARAAVRAFAPDAVHLHEPVAPAVCWDLLGSARAPLVGTFHCHSEAAAPHALGNLAGARRRLNRLHVRLAVSEAAAWTGRRFYGGRYRVVPNGVALPPTPARRPAAPGRLRLAFVGQARERKGLAVVLRAFETLREEVDAELTVVGAPAGEVRPLLVDARGVRALGRVGEDAKAAALRDADVLVAPSLGGESFGLVLLEAGAQGTPVVASDIAGYRDVVRHGREGLLVPPGDAAALARALRDLAAAPGRRAEMGRAARACAERHAWPCVAAQVEAAYEDARAVAAAAACAPPRRRALVAAGLRSADPAGDVRPRRLPPPSRTGVATGRPAGRRRLAIAAGALSGAGALAAGAVLAGPHAVAGALAASEPAWVVLAVAVMAASMALRAAAWATVLGAAGVRAGLRDALSATAVGVLASAALPARLGEPARAVLLARRTSAPRAALPVVAGTLVAQTLLNLLALALLAAASAGTLEALAARRGELLLLAGAPLAVAAAVLAAPALPWLRRTAGRVRSGLRVFAAPLPAARAVALQLGAWALQWLGCWLVLLAVGLAPPLGAGAAAAVLLAVNLAAALPATPGGVGVFQLACVAVLAGAHGVAAGDALAFGLLLQAVELATAVAMGVPALVREGVSLGALRASAHAARSVA